MIVLYVCTLPTFICYFIVSLEAQGAVYVYVVGLPLLLLCVCHLLWAIFNVKSPFLASSSTVFCVLIAIIPSVVLLVHYAINNSNHPYLILECIAATFFHGLVASSWCAAVKASLPLSYAIPTF